jgi:hypothetical protein
MTRPGFEPGPPRWKKPATNRLSYGAAFSHTLLGCSEFQQRDLQRVVAGCELGRSFLGTTTKTNLVAHAGDNRTVPVGCEAGHRLQGKGARWPYESDDMGFEVHISGQTWSDVPGTRRITEATEIAQELSKLISLVSVMKAVLFVLCKLVYA